MNDKKIIIVDDGSLSKDVLNELADATGTLRDDFIIESGPVTIDEAAEKLKKAIEYNYPIIQGGRMNRPTTNNKNSGKRYRGYPSSPIKGATSRGYRKGCFGNKSYSFRDGIVLDKAGRNIANVI